jgi:diguanylate cyclase (GGDEF)-like protein
METFNCQGEKSESVFRLNNFLPSCFVEGSGIEGDLSDAMLLFIRTKTHPQGVVMLFNEPGMPFLSDINYKNLNFVIDQSSLALENAARYTTARSLLYVDELTGLFNYRYLEVAMEREIKRAERYGSSLAVIFLDMDLFKQVNDNHGHLNGTKVLREVGLLISKSVRDVDTVIRYGGDEYTVILVETDMAGAAVVAERIRLTIEQHDFLVAEGLKVKLTASLGYSCFPENSRFKMELLELADQAMYRGKASGKNVVYSLSGRKSGRRAGHKGN